MPLPLHETEHGISIGGVEFVWAKNAREFFFSNSIVIQDTELLVVDPSANFSYFEKLASLKKPTTVLNTHYHIDHRSLNHLFTNARFFCHEADKPMITSFDNYLKYADQSPDSSYVMWLKGIFSSLEIRYQPIHETVQDQALLPVALTPIEVFHLPGHTPGHIGLHFKDLSVLYISDVDLTPMGPWYANLCSDIDLFLQSIEKIKSLKVDYYISSHGERVYDPERFLEKITRFEEAFHKRDERIFEKLQAGPMSFEDLAATGIIYKTSHLSDPLKRRFQEQMLKKHLDRLIDQKRLILVDGLYFPYLDLREES